MMAELIKTQPSQKLKLLTKDKSMVFTTSLKTPPQSEAFWAWSMNNVQINFHQMLKFKFYLEEWGDKDKSPNHFVMDAPIPRQE